MKKALAVAMLAASALTVGLAACGESGPNPKEARQHLSEAMQGRQEARFVIDLNNWADVLPNVEHTPAPGKVEAQPLSTLVVLGTVEEATPGRAHMWDDTVKEVRTEVPFDSPTAEAKTFHLTVKVDEVVAGTGANPGDSVKVGIALAGGVDAEMVAEGFTSMGQLLLPLYQGSPVFDYDPSLWASSQEGGLIATVSESGALDLPFMPPEDAAELLDGTATLTDVRAAAA